MIVSLFPVNAIWVNSYVADTIISMLKPYQAHVHTITADNGSEFVEHEPRIQLRSATLAYAA